MSELVDLTGAVLDKDTNALLAQCKGAPVDDDGTAPDYGQTPMMCALGLMAMPFPRTPAGVAQAVVQAVAGFAGIVVAAWDSRAAKIAGKLEPGDTCLHSTDPSQSAQVTLKGKKRIAAMLSKTSGGKTMMLTLNGTDDNVQLTHAGAMIEIDKSGDVSILNGSGVGLLFQGSKVHVIGELVAGKGNPPLNFMLGPPTGSPGGPASVPLFPCKGIVPGT